MDLGFAADPPYSVDDPESGLLIRYPVSRSDVVLSVLLKQERSTNVDATRGGDYYGGRFGVGRAPSIHDSGGRGFSVALTDPERIALSEARAIIYQTIKPVELMRTRTALDP